MKKHYFNEETLKQLNNFASEAGRRLDLRRRCFFYKPLEVADLKDGLLEIDTIKGILWFMHLNYGFTMIAEYAQRIATALAISDKPIDEFIEFIIELKKERRCKPIFSNGFFEQIELSREKEIKKGAIKFIRESLEKYSFSDLYSKHVLMEILHYSFKFWNDLRDEGLETLAFALSKAPRHTVERFEDLVVSQIESREYYHSSCETLIRQIPFSSMSVREIKSKLKTLVEPAVHFTFDRYITKNAAAYMINRIPENKMNRDLRDKIFHLIRSEDYAEIGANIKNRKLQKELLLRVLGG